MWEIDPSAEQYSEEDPDIRIGRAKRSLKGHNHYVQDVVLSLDGQYCLSGSWDGTLRLWDLSTGQTTRRFAGHTKDVMSVAFSVDNRQVINNLLLLSLHLCAAARSLMQCDVRACCP